MSLFPEPNFYEIIEWRSGMEWHEIFALLATKRSMPCFIASPDEDNFSVEYRSGTGEFEFQEGDALVFTDEFIVRFPKRKVEGAGILLYGRKSSVP